MLACSGQRRPRFLGRTEIRMQRHILALLAVALSASGLMPACPSAAAQARVDFANRTITIISSFGPGGGYTIYAQLLAHFLGAHLAGRPAVIVRNMPGAGGLSGTNYLHNVAARDGTVLGVVPQTVAIAQALGEAGVKYDARAFNWIGRINSNVEVEQTWHTSAVKTIEDARTKEAILAGTGPDSSSVVFPRILDEMFEMKFRVIPGYEGVNMATLAMEKGEVEGILRPWSVTKMVRPEWLRDKTINLLVQYAAARHPELAAVPAVVELAGSAQQRQVLSLFASGSDIGRSILAPPGMAEDVVAALRAAFMQTLQDPAFIAEARTSGLDLDPLAGERLQETVAQGLNVTPQVVEMARKFSTPGSR
jgi:tripartite-type tricarboxylate transporter receptor subunit TctC